MADDLIGYVKVRVDSLNENRRGWVTPEAWDATGGQWNEPGHFFGRVYSPFEIASAHVCDDEGCPHYGTPHGHAPGNDTEKLDFYWRPTSEVKELLTGIKALGYEEAPEKPWWYDFVFECESMAPWIAALGAFGILYMWAMVGNYVATMPPAMKSGTTWTFGFFCFALVIGLLLYIWRPFHRKRGL